MVHIGDTEKRYDPNVIRQLLPIMEEGDIVTHFFTANPGGVLDSEGRLVPEAKEAEDRGVWFDTAHGRMNFSFDIGERILDQGMTEMMSRFLAMEFTMDQVVTMSTLNPAKAVGVDDRLGSLEVGKQADISVLEVVDGDWIVYDVLGNSRRLDKAVVPVLSVKNGQVFEAGWGPRPWGWEPDRGCTG